MPPTIEGFSIKFKELILKSITLNYLVFKKIIRKELPVKKGMKVLDLGSGTGILSPLFSRVSYIGIDLDRKLVDFSKKNYPYSFKVMDAQKLDFPSTYFDVVLVAGVMHHLSNKESEKVLVEINKVLKKSGKALLIEAIPPIDEINLLGKILRKLDEGHDIRRFDEYLKIFSKYFNIKKGYEKRGGLVDYAVFVLTK